MIGVIHTPGPWVAEEYGVVTTHAPERAQSSRGSAHPQVAMVCIPPGIDTGVAEQAVTARLVAAAPEMLAALKAAEWVMRSHILPEHFDGHAAKAMEQVRAAIRKAEGGGQ
jgi:hypothetical protein